jgi:RNA polymerase sigma factor (sigma-70 family)
LQIGQGFEGVLIAAQHNSPWAYERVYKSLAGAVTGYLRLQGAAEPEDLTSEVFLSVFQGIKGFHGDETKFRSWVFTIAHRRLIDDRRRRMVRPQVADASQAAGVDGPGGNVEEDALLRLSELRVRQLCEGLSADQRDVLLLRLVGGLTIEQVAENLGKTPGAVKALQHRGIAALRLRLSRTAYPSEAALR